MYFRLGGHFKERGLLSLRAKKDEETEHDRESGEGERHRGRTRGELPKFHVQQPERSTFDVLHQMSRSQNS